MFQILIVEDDKELSQLFQKVLEKNGYQVKSASDGAQALEVLDKEYIDLIISDIMMPVMDGYELVSCLLYTSPVQQVVSTKPVVYGCEIVFFSQPIKPHGSTTIPRPNGCVPTVRVLSLIHIWHPQGPAQPSCASGCWMHF